MFCREKNESGGGFFGGGNNIHTQRRNGAGPVSPPPQSPYLMKNPPSFTETRFIQSPSPSSARPGGRDPCSLQKLGPPRSRSSLGMRGLAGKKRGFIAASFFFSLGPVFMIPGQVSKPTVFEKTTHPRPVGKQPKTLHALFPIALNPPPPRDSTPPRPFSPYPSVYPGSGFLLLTENRVFPKGIHIPIWLKKAGVFSSMGGCRRRSLNGVRKCVLETTDEGMGY